LFVLRIIRLFFVCTNILTHDFFICNALNKQYFAKLFVYFFFLVFVKSITFVRFVFQESLFSNVLFQILLFSALFFVHFQSLFCSFL